MTDSDKKIEAIRVLAEITSMSSESFRQAVKGIIGTYENDPNHEPNYQGPYGSGPGQFDR